ncbi:MAG: DUF1351 domain-containing protein [Thomasclavelia spiroformis]|uniref:DUF1351 domain-containing protein n=1 Tax=Thomasclavelia spiroformis TaxID=29348 RepID=UPI003993B769
MLNKLLGGYAAVRIENQEEFEKIKELLAIKNCFLVNKEPVSKMNYPGDVVFGLFRADDGFIYWSQIKDIDTNKYELISVDDLNIETSNNVIEATVVSETEVIDVNEKNMTLTVLNKPETAGIQSNVNELVKLIPAIEAKANVVVDENNYKTFIAKGTGLVPTLRKYAKGLRDEKKKIKDAYMKSFDEFSNNVDSVINALETTAKKIDDEVKHFIDQQKESLRKEREIEINKLKEVLIENKMISKEYADKFNFDEKWLNASCSTKRFKEEVEAQFNSLIEKEKLDKQDAQIIENTIVNTCTVAGVDEKLINKAKYLLLLQQGTNLGDITKMITDEVNALKQLKEGMLEAQKREEALREERFKKHQEELKQVQNISLEANDNVLADEKTGEVYAKYNDAGVTIKIQTPPAKVPEDKIFAYTYRFEGNCKAILTFNKCLKALSKVFKSFKYMEVK